MGLRKPQAGAIEGSAPPSPAQAPMKSAASVLSLLVPSKRPGLQLFRLRPGRCLFLAGLARIEWRHPDKNCHVLLTVCVASGLNLHATALERADDLFSRATAQDLRGPNNSAAALPALERDGEARTAWAAPIGERNAPSSILWPRWGPLSARASLHLADCISPRTRAEVDRQLALDSQAAQTSPVDPSGDADGLGVRLTSYLVDGDDSEGEGEGADGAEGGGADVEPDDASSATSDAIAGGDGLRRRLPPGALAPNASRSATSARRRARTRRALADVAFSGLGWCAVTPIEIEGTSGWARSVGLGSISVSSALGVSVLVRAPLLPHEANQTGTKDWVE